MPRVPGSRVNNAIDWIVNAAGVLTGYRVAGSTDDVDLAIYSKDASNNVTGLTVPGGTMLGTSPARIYRPGYEASPGIEMFPQATITPPAPTGATGTATLDATVLWDGAATWKLVNQTVAGNIALTSAAFAAPIQAPIVAPHFFIPVFVPDYKSLNDIQIVLSMGDAAYTNAFTVTGNYGIGPTGHTDKQRNGWHLIAVAPGDWAVSAGVPTWAMTINSIRYRFFRNATGGNDGIAYFGTPFIYKQSVAQLLLYADDVFRSFYNLGLPIFDSLGLKVNLACAKGWITNPTYMTESMYLDAQSRGHEICVHSLNQIGVNVLGLPAVAADIAENQAYVRDVIKAPFGYKHFVWPNGRYWLDGADRSDLSVLNHIRDTLGMVLGRTTDDPARATTTTAIGMSKVSTKYNQLLLPETFPTNIDKTVVAAKLAIDALIARKGVGTYVMHSIGSGSTFEESTTSATQEIAEYIAGKVAGGLLRCPTGSEFVAGL